MHDPFPKSLLKLITPQQVRSYALAKGWQRVAAVNGDIALFQHPGGNFDQLIVPMDESLDDYGKRLREVVGNLAEFEARPAAEVLTDLIAPESDTLRYRVASLATGRGSIPLVDGIRLLDGAKRSILAASCSVVNPVAHHPRMSRAEAQQLLCACHLGQTENESYAISVSCPLRAVEQDQPLLPGHEPFTRRAVSLLMRSISRLVSAIESDNIPSVFQAGPQQPALSANLCDALLQMQPQEEGSHLDIKASWAATLPAQAPIPAAVRIKHEYFPIIGDVFKELQAEKAPESSLFVGYVDTLNGQPDGEGRMQGDATISIVHEEELRKAHVELNPKDYQVAIHAHSIAGAVKFKGILHLGRRTHRISNISEFARVE